jgi:hypothetical protein
MLFCENDKMLMDVKSVVKTMFFFGLYIQFRRNNHAAANIIRLQNEAL